MQHEVEIVLGSQVDDCVMAPPELGGLTLECPQRHVVELVEHLVGNLLVKCSRVPPEQLVGQHHESVTGVQRQRLSIVGGEGRSATSKLTAVGNVVMHEKGIVKHFDRHRHRERIRIGASIGPARMDAEGGANGLSRSSRIRTHEPIEPSVRLPVGNGGQHRPPHRLAHPTQFRFDCVAGRWGDGHGSEGCTSTCRARLSAGAPSD